MVALIQVECLKMAWHDEKGWLYQVLKPVQIQNKKKNARSKSERKSSIQHLLTVYKHVYISTRPRATLNFGWMELTWLKEGVKIKNKGVGNKAKNNLNKVNFSWTCCFVTFCVCVQLNSSYSIQCVYGIKYNIDVKWILNVWRQFESKVVYSLSEFWGLCIHYVLMQHIILILPPHWIAV